MSKKDVLIKCVYAGPEMMREQFNAHRQIDITEKQNTSTVFCSECGYPLPADAKFCPQCGTKVIPLRPIQPVLSDSDNRPLGYPVYAGPPLPPQESDNSTSSGRSFFGKLYPGNHQKKR